MAIQFNIVNIYLPVLWCFNLKLFPQIFTFSVALSQSYAVLLTLQAWTEGRENI